MLAKEAENTLFSQTPEQRLSELFGTGFHPFIDLHLNEEAQVAWARPGCKPGLESAMPRVLAKEANPPEGVWKPAEWRQAMGLEKADWWRRILLLCRAQLIAIGIEDPGKSGSNADAASNRTSHRRETFVGLPDGEAVNTVLFWPRQLRKITNPLKRLPESVTLYALRQIFTEEKKRKEGAFSDEELAIRLTEWLCDSGLGKQWFEVFNNGWLSAKQIADFRGGENGIIRAHLPTMTERQRQLGAL